MRRFLFRLRIFFSPSLRLPLPFRHLLGACLLLYLSISGLPFFSQPWHSPHVRRRVILEGLYSSVRVVPFLEEPRRGCSFPPNNREGILLLLFDLWSGGSLGSSKKPTEFDPGDAGVTRVVSQRSRLGRIVTLFRKRQVLDSLFVLAPSMD